MIPDVGLTGLKPSEATDPKAVAAKVQGMFMEVMLKTMEDSVGAEDGLFGGSASSDIYRSMMREQIANAMSSQLKSPLESQLNRAFQKASAAKTNETSNGVQSGPEGSYENGVSRGDTIPEVVNTGRATGPHVNFFTKVLLTPADK